MVDFQITSTLHGRPIDTRYRVSKHGVGTEKSAQLDPTEFRSGVHYNLGGRVDNVIPSGVFVAKVGNLYVPYTGALAKVWSLAITGSPTGGTFALSINGTASAGIAYNANAETIAAALNAIAGVSGATVTGSGPFVVTFVTERDVTSSGASLTGGSSPAATTSTTDPRRTIHGFVSDVEGVDLGVTPATSKPTFALGRIAVIDPSYLPVVAQRTSVSAASTTSGTSLIFQ